jgi:hypothetical protein
MIATPSSRRGRLLLGLAAATTLGCSVLVAPPILGWLAADDGMIHNARIVYWLWKLSIGSLCLSILLGSLTAFERWRSLATRRPWVAGLALLALLPLGFGTRQLVLHRGGAVDIVEHLDPDYGPLSPKIMADLPSDSLLAELASYLRHRPPVAPQLRTEHLWAIGDSLARERAIAVLNGRLGQIYDHPEIGWQPGEEFSVGDFPPPLQFQLQRQVFIHYLLDGLPEDRSADATEWLYGFLEAWEADNAPTLPPQPWIWSDDPMGNRAEAREAAMDFLRRHRASSQEREIAHLEWAVRHGQYLMDPRHYTRFSNHGLMQDSGLLVLGQSHPELEASDLWEDTAVQRAERYMVDMVTEHGVLRQLTPFYHHHSTQKLLWFYVQARKSGHEFSAEFERRLRKMIVFHRRILNPDGTYPQIADSDGIRADLSNWPWEALPAWAELRDLEEALAQRDVPPDGPGATLWPDSGYFVLRPPVDPYLSSTATMLTFTAGPPSHGHDHRNKLSITLFGHGSRIISGPGYPSYFDQPRRSELIATPSQSTISVDGGNQRLGHAPLDIHHTIGQGAGLEATVVSAVSRLYDGVSHRRTVAFGPEPDAFVVVDRVRSESEHRYDVHYRLARDLRVQGFADGNRELLVTRQNTPVLRMTYLARTPSDNDGSISLLTEPPMVGIRLEDSGEWTVVSYLDLSPEEKTSSLTWESDRLVWRSSTGSLDLPWNMEDWTREMWSPDPD